ncbi:ABC transporter related protein [Sporocytophaga myxococcoides]|uniref:ABC transporter related protein n=1 Tax=Sporocytophaga myxococcoides TaxID=153721 RepID=A0A098LN68_9BACT|nr:ABC transporter ATP-binding protein [Sporocytophaga myxococcoides]GAL87762.1 ABC transporter related protein [Sporocytophaga myxococcoides]
MLEARNIYKGYPHLEVLKGIDLQIKQGEIVSVVGASGAGKTTLLHILGTLDKQDKGELFINGVNLNQIGDKELALFRNNHIGFVFQFHNLLPEFSCFENVCLPGYIGKRDKKQVEQKAKELLDRLGLSQRLNHKPSELSGGEQQRTSVARALINSPSIVFADEPSGNLDSNNAEELHKLFFELRNEFNLTFVIVTHNQSLAKSADRKLEMRDGKIV